MINPRALLKVPKLSTNDITFANLISLCNDWRLIGKTLVFPKEKESLINNIEVPSDFSMDDLKNLPFPVTHFTFEGSSISYMCGFVNSEGKGPGFEFFKLDWINRYPRSGESLLFLSERKYSLSMPAMEAFYNELFSHDKETLDNMLNMLQYMKYLVFLSREIETPMNIKDGQIIFPELENIKMS